MTMTHFNTIEDKVQRERVHRAYTKHSKNLDAWNKMILNVQAQKDSTEKLKRVKAAKRTLIELQHMHQGRIL